MGATSKAAGHRKTLPDSGSKATLWNEEKRAAQAEDILIGCHLF